jgi:hypothetical protein
MNPMKPLKKIKAEIWQVKICDSGVDIVHNNYRIIKELYIPSEGISCNLADENLHCFIDETDRYGRSKENTLIKKIDISPIFVKKAKEYIKTQQELLVNLKTYIK